MRKLVTIEIPLEFEDDDEVLSLPNEEIAKRIDETVLILMSVGQGYDTQIVTVRDFE